MSKILLFKNGRYSAFVEEFDLPVVDWLGDSPMKQEKWYVFHYIKNSDDEHYVSDMTERIKVMEQQLSDHLDEPNAHEKYDYAYNMYKVMDTYDQAKAKFDAYVLAHRPKIPVRIRSVEKMKN